MSTRKVLIKVVVVVLVSMSTAAWADPNCWYVDRNGSDLNDGNSWDEAFGTIQKGIDRAGKGDVVQVKKGTYYETVDFKGKAITVRGTDPNSWVVVAATIINAKGLGSVVTFDSKEDANSMLTGFTITRGSQGISCRKASPTISNCVITRNGNQSRGAKAKKSRGGGMYNTRGSSPRVTSCFFVGNTAVEGGGMANWDKSCPTVTNCVFYKNTAASDGGGMANEESSPRIINCTFFGNDAVDEGGGIYGEDGSDPKLYNCIFWGNDAGGKGSEIYNCDNSKPVFDHCYIEGDLNKGKCAGDDSEDDGDNEEDDPEFVNSNDPNGADNTWGTSDDGLALRSTSPCIDDGTNSVISEPNDIAGNARKIDGDKKASARRDKRVSARRDKRRSPRRDKRRSPRVDVGAYEYDPRSR